jgi:hypothetical protein
MIFRKEKFTGRKPLFVKEERKRKKEERENYWKELEKEGIPISVLKMKLLDIDDGELRWVVNDSQELLRDAYVFLRKVKTSPTDDFYLEEMRAEKEKILSSASRMKEKVGGRRNRMEDEIYEAMDAILKKLSFLSI